MFWSLNDTHLLFNQRVKYFKDSTRLSVPQHRVSQPQHCRHWGRIILCCVRHCRTLSRIPRLYPLDASISSQTWQPQLSQDIAKDPLGAKPPQLRTTALTQTPPGCAMLPTFPISLIFPKKTFYRGFIRCQHSAEKYWNTTTVFPPKGAIFSHSSQMGKLRLREAKPASDAVRTGSQVCLLQATTINPHPSPHLLF